MDISVLIPTYNRAALLKKSLEALFEQSIKNFEIIIIDDGSTDTTKEIVKKMASEQKKLIEKAIILRYFKQKNTGQGNARNFGIKHAQGDICLLIGDDIIGTQKFLEEHVKLHKKHHKENVAVLGRIEWHPDIKITPFMKWITNGSCILGKYGGHQFAFEKLEGKKEADYRFFYTSNISLKTSLLKKNPFDSDFQKYGWEDIELGYRLTKKMKLKIYYNPEALAFHYHPMNEKSLKPRMRQIAQSGFIIQKKYPELHAIPSRKKKFIFWLISNPLALSIFSIARKLLPLKKMSAYYYYALSKKYYLEGLKSHKEPLKNVTS
ncbi:glycosyltransferase family 2 protein [Candidatus Peregrinibacteria bacterium]|nr:glycosyltransferase family 2 protein [Candidatus Peregrinibacteria bacterium]